MPARPNDVKKIKKLQKKFNKIELLVIKQTKATSKLGSSRPCVMCLKMMQILKIKNVFYTNSYGDIVMEKGLAYDINAPVANDKAYGKSNTFHEVT